VSTIRHAVAVSAYRADAIAAAALGFALGVCVNAGVVPQMRWLLWMMSGH
jgi:hypothetical protein